MLLSWLPADIERWLWALGIGSTRTIPLAWMLPAFGGQNVPAHVRMGIGLALAVLCLPQIQMSLPDTQSGMMFWILLLARETAVGFTVGYVGSAIFRAAEAAGRLIDTLRGANMAEVLSPVSEGRSSPLGDVLVLMTTVIFLELDGVGYVAMALARSYEAVPLTLTTTAASLAGVGRLALLSSAQLLQSALALAAPAIVAMLLADIVLGAIARMAPQIPVYFVGMPLKALAGVGIVLVSLGTIQTALVSGFTGWMAVVERGFAIWR